MQDVHPSFLQRLMQQRPVKKGDFKLYAHGFANGPGQIHVEPGGMAVFVQKFVGRIVAITADNNGRPGHYDVLRIPQADAYQGKHGKKQQHRESKASPAP